MASNRIGRINEEIQRELSSLLRTIKDPRLKDSMISVTAVQTTPDLRFAKVYVSCLNKTGSKDMMRGLRSASGFLRRELAQRLRLRYTPELQFEQDDSIDHGAHILQIIESLDIRQDDTPEGTEEEA